MAWPERDRWIAIALDRVERNTGQNGEWQPDAESERADPNYYGTDRVRFTAEGPFTNYAEKARLDAEEKWKKEAGENANTNGMFWRIRTPDQPSV